MRLERGKWPLHRAISACNAASSSSSAVFFWGRTGCLPGGTSTGPAGVVAAGWRSCSSNSAPSNSSSSASSSSCKKKINDNLRDIWQSFCSSFCKEYNSWTLIIDKAFVGRILKEKAWLISRLLISQFDLASDRMKSFAKQKHRWYVAELWLLASWQKLAFS